MKCFRHSISVECGNNATRVFLLENKSILQYCDDCARDMIRSWEGSWSMDDGKRPLKWEELPKEVLDIMDIHDA